MGNGIWRPQPPNGRARTPVPLAAGILSLAADAAAPAPTLTTVSTSAFLRALCVRHSFCRKSACKTSNLHRGHCRETGAEKSQSGVRREILRKRTRMAGAGTMWIGVWRIAVFAGKSIHDRCFHRCALLIMSGLTKNLLLVMQSVRLPRLLLPLVRLREQTFR